MHTTTRLLLVLGLSACLSLSHCVIGGGAACKVTADCGGSDLCLNGVCFPPGADVPAFQELSSLDEPIQSNDLPNFSDHKGETHTGADATSESAPGPDASPETLPEPIIYGPQQQRLGLSSGGGRMSSVTYRLYGSLSAGLVASPKTMSSPNFQLKAGLLSGTQP